MEPKVANSWTSSVPVHLSTNKINHTMPKCNGVWPKLFVASGLAPLSSRT